MPIAPPDPSARNALSALGLWQPSTYGRVAQAAQPRSGWTPAHTEGLKGLGRALVKDYQNTMDWLGTNIGESAALQIASLFLPVAAMAGGKAPTNPYQIFQKLIGSVKSPRIASSKLMDFAARAGLDEESRVLVKEYRASLRGQSLPKQEALQLAEWIMPQELKAGVAAAAPKAEKAIPMPQAAAQKVPAAVRAAPTLEQLMNAMDRLNPRAKEMGAAVSIQELRAQYPNLSKEAFDKMMMDAAATGKIALHHHDWPYSLSPADRAQLIYEPARKGSEALMSTTARGTREEISPQEFFKRWGYLPGRYYIAATIRK